MDRKVLPPQHQVFINFRGDELRNNFISHLVDALRRNTINVFIDKEEKKGEDINNLFKRIEESKIAVAVFSRRYTESRWCLDELVKMKERADLGKLKVYDLCFLLLARPMLYLVSSVDLHINCITTTNYENAYVISIDPKDFSNLLQCHYIRRETP